MRSLLGFPKQVNEVAARSVATGVFALGVIAIAAHQPWLTIPLAYGFVVRVLAGPRFSPLGQFATRVVAPRLKRHAHLVPGPPKRFAQMMGAAFTLSALALWLSGELAACDVLIVMLVIAAGLEAFGGFCIGCQVFGLGMRFGLVPESTCRECAELFGPAARARRHAPAATH
jgi:hypothetical protein